MSEGLSPQSVIAEILRSQEEKDRIREELMMVSEDSDRIRRGDPSRMVSVPDEVPDSDCQVDLEEIERQLFGAALLPTGQPPTDLPIRNWLSIDEFAELAGVSSKQVRLWIKGESLPRGPTGHPTRPWEPNSIPVDEALGRNRRRVVVDGLNEKWLNQTAERSQRLKEIVSDWPTNWAEKWHLKDASAG